ncbi:hypothetical protein ACN47E_004757 [Coniothyrium glycines]
MGPDEALPPAIRRSPAAAFEQHKFHQRPKLQDDYHESDDSPDEATPPPIVRSRSSSVDTETSAHTRSHPKSSPRLNPLRAHPVEPAPSIPPRHNYPHSHNREKLQTVPTPEPPSVNPRRSSRGLVSYRTNKKIPLHLRQQPSLETIASVTTTASEDYHDPPEAEAPSPDWFTQDGGASATPVPASRSSCSTYASSTGSKQSSTPGATPLEIPLESTSLGHHSPQSLFRKMMPRKIGDLPPSPTRLVIGKSTSIDCTSNPPTSSKSTTSLTSMKSSTLAQPTAPAPSERTVGAGVRVVRSQLGSSGEWSASSFDISTLTEAEVKRCKKKGINPALYAEMRAAKGRKWTSPIAGNTFL